MSRTITVLDAPASEGNSAQRVFVNEQGTVVTMVNEETGVVQSSVFAGNAREEVDRMITNGAAAALAARKKQVTEWLWIAALSAILVGVMGAFVIDASSNPVLWVPILIGVSSVCVFIATLGIKGTIYFEARLPYRWEEPRFEGVYDALLAAPCFNSELTHREHHDFREGLTVKQANDIIEAASRAGDRVEIEEAMWRALKEIRDTEKS